MKYNILKLSQIFENFIDKHKSLNHNGSEVLLDKNPERDLEVEYKGDLYIITIRKAME
jgi:hypothetical protein